MNNTLRKFLHIPYVLIGMLLTYGCTPDPGSVIKSGKTLPAGIWAFLNTAADSQYVVLSTTDYWETENEHVLLDAEVPLIRKAQVWLTDGSQSFALEPVYTENPHTRFALANGFLRYWATTETIKPGITYRLKVSIPKKGEFSATATTPGDFKILSPTAEDTVDVFSPINVKWTAAEGAAAYRIDLWYFIEYRKEVVGNPDVKVIKNWNNSWRGAFIKAEPEPSFILQHTLARYYANSPHPDTLYKAVLLVDALDEAAWTAYRIAKEKEKKQSDSDYRIDPVSYSNIAGGWGLMTASTSKYVELLLPKGQK